MKKEENKKSSTNNEAKTKAKVEQKKDIKSEKTAVPKTEVKAEAVATPKTESKIKGTVTIERKDKKSYTKWIGLFIAIIVIIAVIVGIVFFSKSPYYAVMRTFNALKNENINVINSYVSYE